MTTPQSNPPSATPHAEIGVIGGSGFYSFLDEAHEVSVDTPFGPPSDPVSIGRVGGRRVAFLPRHGRDHRYLPHRVNYRANLWALRALGVRQVVAPCAVGSLRTDLGPGSLVIPDQVIDRTWGRETSVFDVEGPVVHIGFADPYCPRGRATLSRAAEATGWTAVTPATLVVVNGPRFSSRAESRWHAAVGADIVNMTGMPEAAVARELALCYTTPALVTDVDAGVVDGEGVVQSEVFATFTRHLDRLRDLLLRSLVDLPGDDECPCQHSLDGIRLPIPLP
jgi:5'-methylthioadenosine phosphorylase